MDAEFLEKLKVLYKQGVLLLLFPFELYNQGSFTPYPLTQRIIGKGAGWWCAPFIPALRIKVRDQPGL